MKERHGIRGAMEAVLVGRRIRQGNNPTYKLSIPYFQTASVERLMHPGKQLLSGIRFGIQANKTGMMLWNSALLMQIGIDRRLAYASLYYSVLGVSCI